MLDDLNNLDRKCTLPGDRKARQWTVIARSLNDERGPVYKVANYDTGGTREARLSDMADLW